MARGKPLPWGRSKPPAGAILDRFHPINRGIYGTWLLNEGGGKIAVDIAGKNNLAFGSGASHAVGRFGKTLTFDGTANGNLYKAGMVPNLSATAQASMSCWVYATSISAASPVQYPGVNTSTQCLGFYMGSATQLRFDAINFGATNTIASIASKLSHLMVTYDGANRLGYLNGVLISTEAQTGAFPTTTNELNIGRFSSFPFNPWTGIVENVRIWTRALNASEVLSLYNEPFVGIVRNTRQSGMQGPAGGAPTAALTGNLATTSAGLVVPALSLAVTGNAVTTSQGTVAPGITLALTGNSVTASVGTPVAALNLALIGNATTATAGIPTSSTDGNVSLSGNAASATQGTVSPGITIALTGNGATASVGALGKTISLALSGLAGTSSAGIVVPGLSKALTGNAATASAGSVGVLGGALTVALTGNSVTASAGSVTPISGAYPGESYFNAMARSDTLIPDAITDQVQTIATVQLWRSP